MWDADGPVTNLLTVFTVNFKDVFGQNASMLSVHDQFNQFRQGRYQSDYALQFHTLAAIRLCDRLAAWGYITT